MNMKPIGYAPIGSILIIWIVLKVVKAVGGL